MYCILRIRALLEEATLVKSRVIAVSKRSFLQEDTASGNLTCVVLRHEVLVRSSCAAGSPVCSL